MEKKIRCLLKKTEFRWELSCLYEALSNLDEAENFLLLCKTDISKAKENSLGGFFGLWNPFQRRYTAKRDILLALQDGVISIPRMLKKVRWAKSKCHAELNSYLHGTEDNVVWFC